MVIQISADSEVSLGKTASVLYIVFVFKLFALTDPKLFMRSGNTALCKSHEPPLISLLLEKQEMGAVIY